MHIIKGPGETPEVPEKITPPKTAKLEEGLEAEPLAPNKNRVPAAGETPAPHYPHEEITILAPSLPTLPKATELIKETITGNNLRHEQARLMAKALDEYVEEIFPKQVSHAIDHAVKSAEKSSPEPLSGQEKMRIHDRIEEKIRKKVGDSVKFFTTIDTRKGPEAPLERMGAPFEYLPVPDPREEFDEAMQKYAAEFVRRAFDQHLDNPEQYCSHGFDHSINVANYTKDVLKLNPEIVEATKEKYHITEGEAKFMLETVALLHDCGYPCVGCRSKSVHGISGADLVLPMRPLFDEMITSREVDKEVLFNDFRNSILFHSADKIEQEYTTKIVTTLGTFLADHKDIVEVLSHFYDPSKNPSTQPKYATEIYVQNPAMKDEIVAALKASEVSFKEKVGASIPPDFKLPDVKVYDGTFKGRRADLEKERDRKLGLEFTKTDLLKTPFNMIRLVDNMDMSSTRLTPNQNEPAFREIYHRLGDNGAICQLASKMNQIEEEMNKWKTTIVVQRVIAIEGAQNVDNLIMKRLLSNLNELMDILPKQEKLDPLALEVFKKIREANKEDLKVPKDISNLIKEALIDTIFEQDKFKDLPIDQKEDIRHIGMLQSKFDLPHFGGCEAVKGVRLEGIALEEGKKLPHVIVEVYNERFPKLNAIKVSETTTSPTKIGDTISVRVGVGEYQIWRANDAYRSLLLGDKNIQLSIRDEDGHEITLSVI